MFREAVQADAGRVILDLRANARAEVLHKVVQAEAGRVVLDYRAGVGAEMFCEAVPNGTGRVIVDLRAGEGAETLREAVQAKAERVVLDLGVVLDLRSTRSGSRTRSSKSSIWESHSIRERANVPHEAAHAEANLRAGVAEEELREGARQG